MSGHGLTRRQRRYAAKKATRRKARDSFTTLTNVSGAENDLTNLLSESLVGLVRRMKSAMHRPTAGQILEIVRGFAPDFVFESLPNEQEVNDDNIVHDQFIKIMLLQYMDLILNDQKRSHPRHPLLTMIEHELDTMATGPMGERLPNEHAFLHPDLLDRYLKRQLGEQYQLTNQKKEVKKQKKEGGGGALGTLAKGMMISSAVAHTRGEQYQPVVPTSSIARPSFMSTQPSIYPSGTAISTFPTTSEPPRFNYSNTAVSNSNNENEEKSNHTIMPHQPTSARRTYNNEAVAILQNSKITHGQRNIAHSDKKLLALSDGIFKWTGMNLYSPFTSFEPLVSSTTKQKFAFIRDQMELLKKKLAIHAPERHAGLQYNSIVNVLQAIRIGQTKLVNDIPDSFKKSYTEVNEPKAIDDLMVYLANYDERLTDIYTYVQRKKPTSTEAVKAFFGVESNYVIEQIVIFFRVSKRRPGQDLLYISFTPIQFDRNLRAFAARFIMPNVHSVADVIHSLDGVLQLDASYIGFWHPSTPTASIIANLQSANAITKQIIADMGSFSKIAHDLTTLTFKDLTISGLSKVVHDPSKAIEVRLKSYQLQDSISTLASSHMEWDLNSLDQIANLAASMAATSGQLDQTIQDEKALMEFITTTTAKFGNALKQSIDAVADSANFFGGSLQRFARSSNQLSKNLIRSEIIFLYFSFFAYYVTQGSCTMRLLSWIAPMINPVAPVIALEQVLEHTINVEPSPMTMLLMLYLFYRVWDKEKVAPITNTVMEFIDMCKCSRASVPTMAREVAPVVAPVVAPPLSARRREIRRAQRSARNIAAAQRAAAEREQAFASPPAVRTPRSVDPQHILAARTRADFHSRNQNRAAQIDEIMITLGISREEAERHISLGRNTEEIARIMSNTLLSYPNAVDYVHSRGGRHTRKRTTRK